MAKIIDVVVIDETIPVAQAGFKSVLIVAFGEDIQTETISDVSTLTPGTEMHKQATAFFNNGGNRVTIAGAVTADEIEGAIFLSDLIESGLDFYGVVPIIALSKQAVYIKELAQVISANKLMMISEINMSKLEAITLSEELSSDRVSLYANAEDGTGIASAVSGMGYKFDEGSLTWGNQVVKEIPKSGFVIGDEIDLLIGNVNYITEEKGYIMTQMGRTTSGSNIDITRSKDWLENRLAEELTKLLVTSQKIPYTTAGMAMIGSSMNLVGVQAVETGMLSEFLAVVPDLSSIPAVDKANRVLRGVKFVATLSGAIETIEVELLVRL